MPQLRLLSVAILLTCLLTSFSAASVTIDLSERRLQRGRLGFTGQTIENLALGQWDATIGADGELFASQSSYIGDTGHYSGTGESTGFTNFYASSAIAVEFTLSSIFAYSFDRTLLQTGGDSVVGLYSFSSASYIDALFSNGTLNTSGLLSPGKYALVAAANSANATSSQFTFDFQLTTPSVAVVPEPASLAVWSCLGLSCVGMTALRRRRRSAIVVA